MIVTKYDRGASWPLSPVLFSSRQAAMPPLMDKTALIKQFIFNAGSSIVSVEFIKADGSVRRLQFNPRDTKEIKGERSRGDRSKGTTESFQGTGTATKKPSIVRCRDFSIARSAGEGAWRSFDCERVISVKANGQALSF